MPENSTPEPAPAVPPPPPIDAPVPAAPRLRDRVFRLRAVLAVAAAGVIVGGAAGAGITAVADGHRDSRPHFGRFGPGQVPGGGMPGGGFPGQGFPGQGQQGQPAQPAQPGKTS